MTQPVPGTVTPDMVPVVAPRQVRVVDPGYDMGPVPDFRIVLRFDDCGPLPCVGEERLFRWDGATWVSLCAPDRGVQ